MIPLKIDGSDERQQQAIVRTIGLDIDLQKFYIGANSQILRKYSFTTLVLLLQVGMLIRNLNKEHMS